MNMMFSWELSVGADIHNDVCEYVYLTKLHKVFVSSSGVLIWCFYEYGSFWNGLVIFEKGF